MRVKIRLKLVLLMTAAALLPMMAALVWVAAEGRDLRIKHVGHDQMSVATAQAATLQNSLQGNIQKVLLALQDDPDLTDELPGMFPLRSMEEMRQLDAIWAGEPFPWDDPVVIKVLNNHISAHLHSIMINSPEIVELLVTDIQGCLVAASGRTTDFHQADEAWWQGAYAGGEGSIHIPPAQYDESAGVWSVSICIPLSSKDEEIIGVAKAVLDLPLWIEVTNSPVGTESIEGTLINEFGEIIYPHSDGIVEEQRPAWAVAISRETVAGSRPIEDGMIRAYAPVSLPDEIGRLPVSAPRWTLVLQQPAAQALAEVDRMMWLVVGAGMVVILLVFTGGLLLVDRGIGRRIRRLQSVTSHVGRGDFSQRAHERTAHFGTDEIDDLAESFNNMMDRVAKSHEELTEANELKSSFIKVAGHELRTPLSYIIAMPKLLAGITDVEKLQQGIHNMQAKGRRLNDVVQSMFKLMPEQDYSEYLNLRDVQLSDILENVYADCLPFVEERDQTLLMPPCEDFPTLRVDADKIRDVIENLVGNAIKFTPVGRTIRVEAARHGEEHIDISVIDTGPGISRMDLPNIFNPFYSTGDVMKHTSGSIGETKHGMGLGLAVVKHFTEMHGGAVDVETGSHGSTFTVTLPIRPPARGERQDGEAT